MGCTQNLQKIDQLEADLKVLRETCTVLTNTLQQLENGTKSIETNVGEFVDTVEKQLSNVQTEIIGKIDGFEKEFDENLEKCNEKANKKK